MKNKIAKFKEYLNANSLKQTAERMEIAKAVTLFEDTFTVDELMDKIKKNGWPVSQATLYRSIPLLIDAGMIKPLAPHHLNNHTFKRCEVDDPDKSHFCQKCKMATPVNDDIINDINEQLSEKYDVNEVIDSLLFMKGVCPDCLSSFEFRQPGIYSDQDISNIRIILLEDESIFRNLLSNFLTRKGFEVLAFNDPSELNLKCVCNSNENVICADFLIADIKMPDMNGTEFIKKQIEKNCRIKNIAFLSAFWNMEYLDYAGSIGAAIFHKPTHLFDIYKWIIESVSNISKERILGNELIK